MRTRGGISGPCRQQLPEETEKQELKGELSPQYFESQLSPDMMEDIATTPKPKQLGWGDSDSKAKAMMVDNVGMGCVPYMAKVTYIARD